jgi:hypothetical protein
MTKTPTTKQQANLKPFSNTDPEARARASANGRKGQLIKKQRAALAQQQKLGNSEEAKHALDQALSSFQRDTLGPGAIAAAQMLIARVLTGDVPVRHAGDAADLIRVLVDVGRLEGGEATSLSVTMDAAAVTARIEMLRREAEPVRHGVIEQANTLTIETETTEPDRTKPKQTTPPHPPTPPPSPR